MEHILSYRIGSLQKPHLPFQRVADLGVQGLELGWNEQTTVDAVQAAVEPAGLRVTSLQVQAPLEQEDLAQSLDAHAEVAAALGAQYLFVSVRTGELEQEAAYQRLREAGDAVGSHAVYLAMETHPDLCENGDKMRATMAAVNHPWVRINYDTANVYFYNEGVDTVVEARKAAQYVRGVHLKDTMGGFRDNRFPVFGQGIVDFAGVGAVLDEAGYSGPYCMELEGPYFRDSEPDDLAAKVQGCVAHLRSLGLVR